MSSKILLVLETFNIGGAERQAFNLALGLQERGYNVVIGAFNTNGPLLAECKDKSIATLKLPGGFHSSSFKFHQPRRKLFFSFFMLWRTLAKAKASVIIPFTAPCNVAVNFVARYIPASVNFWNQRDEGMGITLDGYYVITKALANCKNYISNSTEGADFIKHLAGNPALKVNLVYNGIIQKAPARTKDKWKEELHISEKSKMAIMIANVHSAKDHETAIKAWHLVVKEFALDAILVFAGNFDEKSELYKQLVALIEQLQLKNHILFTGFVADMPGLIQASDICVFSSHREGLPNAVLEPMSYGIPVAATDLPGVREVLGDDYPFISPHKDHKALAANTVLLLQNSEEYQKTAVRNLNRINTLFSVDTMVNNYVSLIEQHA